MSTSQGNPVIALYFAYIATALYVRRICCNRAIRFFRFPYFAIRLYFRSTALVLPEKRTDIRMMKCHNSCKSDFTKSCKCISHTSWCTDLNEIPDKIDLRKKFKASVISKLREEKLLPDCANHLCNSCYNEFVKWHQLDDVQE